MQLWQRLQRDGRTLVTSSLVLAESHALIVRSGDAVKGVAFLDGFLVHLDQQVVWVDQELIRASVDNWLRPYRDKRWSLTDAVSFEVMKRGGIRQAFAFDDHFEQAGFTLL